MLASRRKEKQKLLLRGTLLEKKGAPGDANLELNYQNKKKITNQSLIITVLHSP